MMRNGKVIRTEYLKKLDALRGNRKVVKVLTGMRGVGKTTIMSQFLADLVKGGKPEADIICIDLDSVAFNDIKTGADLKNLVSKSIDGHNDPYIFIDEPQKISEWDDAIARLVDVGVGEFFLTASDSTILETSQEVLSGAMKEVRVYPLSLPEFMELNGMKEPIPAAEAYLDYGGLPTVRASMDCDEAYSVLRGLLSNAVLKDCLNYKKSLDPETAMSVVNHIFDIAGTPIDGAELTVVSGKSFGYTDRAIKALVGTYLMYEDDNRSLTEKLKKTQMRFYVADNGLRNCITGITVDTVAKVECALYAELVRRYGKVTVEAYDAVTPAFAVDGDRPTWYIVSDTPKDIGDQEPAEKKGLFGGRGLLRKKTYIQVVPAGVSSGNVITIADLMMNGFDSRKDDGIEDAAADSIHSL